MRSTKFPALAAAAAMLALAPAGASAAGGHTHLKAGKHAAGIGQCHLSIRVEAPQIVAGEADGVRGKLNCRGASTAPVTLYGRTVGGGSFQAIGTPTTANGAGTFQFEVPAVKGDTVLYASAAGAKSAEKLVKVAPVVTMTGPTSGAQLVTGLPASEFKVSAPGDGGASVLLERENPSATEEWGVIQQGQLNGNGEYTFNHRFAVAGGATIRAVVRPHGTFSARGISDESSYEISDREINNLKIAASADPISAGQSFELTGEVASTKAPVEVVLLARGRGASFQSVAKTTTVEGKYKFTQTPAQNTLYRVMVAGKLSGVVFEGVKRVLTAAVIATSVASLQSLEFSGTVTPAQANQPVYLERKNSFGGGWHVVPALLSTNGVDYKITHQVSGSGPESFRIKVPGDPAFETTASSPFVIQVTPATK